MSRPAHALAPAQSLAAASDYLALLKPRVVLMILVVTAVGFMMGSTALTPETALRFLHTLLGTALVAGGTLALNQYLERDLDALMSRTRGRPLPAGRMRPAEALLFGAATTAAGTLWLTLMTRPLAGLVTAMTVIGYLFLYTPLKRRSALCTVAGAFPGALPPVTGWVAARGRIEPGAIALFAILFFWQLPHALAIAQLYREDYDRAGIRMLPTVDRERGSTGRQALLNCMALLCVGLIPTAIGLAGWVTLATATGCGLLMLGQCAAMAARPTPRSARRLLLASYLYIPAVMTALVGERLLV